MLDPQRVHRALDHRVSRLLRRGRSRGVPAVIEEPLRLVSTVGYQVSAHIHRPADATGRLPAVLLCPGTNDPGTVFDGLSGPISADEVARLGAVVLHFDPAGRGESWGEEDYGGDEHQDEVAVALRYLASRPDVDPARIGVVAVSLGVAMAVGGVCRAGTPVAWLLDWEGPCDREIITAGGSRMAPALGHTLDDERYWKPREAVRKVGELPCPYVRLQAEGDHAQPGELRHAQRMLHAASAGRLPWFQINDHPRGEAPPRPVWLDSGPRAAHKALLRKVQTLLASP